MIGERTAARSGVPTEIGFLAFDRPDAGPEAQGQRPSAPACQSRVTSSQKASPAQRPNGA